MINVLLSLMIVVSFLLAIALHESGHALVALWLGDRTPQAEGRQSLSLRTHIDPVGMLMCIILAFVPAAAGPVGFGWGKPVKADPWKMRIGANAGVLTVAWAGPLFNLIIGLLLAVLVRFTIPFVAVSVVMPYVFQFLIVFATINIALTLFNLLPLYPLDAYQIVYTLLPSKQAVQFAKSAQYGPFIILGIFFFIPFIVRIAAPALADFPLFRLSYYILLGALNLVSLVVGPFPGSYELVQALYFYPGIR